MNPSRSVDNGRAGRVAAEPPEPSEERPNLPTAWQLAREALVKAGIYAPIAFGVGLGLLAIAKRKFLPAVTI